MVAIATMSSYGLEGFAMRQGSGGTRQSSGDDVARLRQLVQSFVRSFGLLVTKETPCGHPVSPSYAHALMVLLERTREHDRTSQSDLGRLLGIDKSNVTRLCARMEAAGHVVQDRQPDDGRGRLVRLTSTGTRMAQRIEQASRERFERVVGGVAPGRRQSVFEALELLNAAVEALGDES